jgi:hypothetical protein
MTYTGARNCFDPAEGEHAATASATLRLLGGVAPGRVLRPRMGLHDDAGVAGTATAVLPAAQLVSRSLVANCAGVRIGRSSLRTSRSWSPVTRYARRLVASARR